MTYTAVHNNDVPENIAITHRSQVLHRPRNSNCGRQQKNIRIENDCCSEVVIYYQTGDYSADIFLSLVISVPLVSIVGIGNSVISLNLQKN